MPTFLSALFGPVARPLPSPHLPARFSPIPPRPRATSSASSSASYSPADVRAAQAHHLPNMVPSSSTDGHAQASSSVSMRRRTSMGGDSSDGTASDGGRQHDDDPHDDISSGGAFDLSLKPMDLDPSPPRPSAAGKSSLKKRPSVSELQSSTGSSRRRLSSASSSTGSTTAPGQSSPPHQDIDPKPSAHADSPVSTLALDPPPPPPQFLVDGHSNPPVKRLPNGRARPVALNLNGASPTSIAPERPSVAPPPSSTASSFEIPPSILMPINSDSLGPPSALMLDATPRPSGEQAHMDGEARREQRERGDDNVAQHMDVDSPPVTLASSSGPAPPPSFLRAPPPKRGLRGRPSALSLASSASSNPDLAPISQLDLGPSPPTATVPLLLLPEDDSLAGSSSSSTPSVLSLPSKSGPSLRVKPSPLALNLSSSLSVNRPNLHISPSAPNLRQASTAALTPSASWASPAPPPPSSLGKGKRNAKGLSLSLGFGSASPGSSASETSSPGLAPAPSTGTGGGARFNMRPPHTSIPPQTPSSSAHFQTSFSQQAGPPSSSASSSSQSQRPNLLALLPTYERDPTDHASTSTNAANRPYADGPIEVLPGLFIGSEENARDWQTLTSSRFNIGRVVNVAKELVGSGDEYGTAEEDQAKNLLRPAVSTPNLRLAAGGVATGKVEEKTYVLPNGRRMEYLHLPWSHGQADLVSGGEGGQGGFTRAGEWVGEGLVRGEGVLVHCQCGISRSATLVIAIVMRLAAEGNMVEELGEVRGMHDAYEFVKAKSPWIGPNVSLIYQLLEWERLLAAQTAHLPQVISSNNSSNGSSVSTPMHRGFSTEVESEEDWSRRRAELEALEEAEELDRDMEERLRRSRTTSASSTASGSSSGGVAPVVVNVGGRPKPPFGIKRRISGSSLASEITLEEEEEEEEAGMEEESETSDKEATRTPLEVDQDAMMVDGPSEGVRSERGVDEMDVSESAAPKATTTKFAAPPNGTGRANRKRSSTLSFTPSLDPLPSSPTTIADPSAPASGSAALLPPPPPTPLRSRAFQTHAKRASLSSLNELFPASPAQSSFPQSSFPQSTPDDPPRSDTPSSLASSTSTSTRRSSLASFSRPPPILSSHAEPPRSMQQLLFFPPSPNRSTDPSTPTMTHSISTFLSSPAPGQASFGSTSTSSRLAESPITATSPQTAVPPPPRLRSMIPPIISPTTGTLNESTTPLGNMFGGFFGGGGGRSDVGPAAGGGGGGGGGWGGFGSSHSPKQRKDLHRKTFSLDVKTLVPLPSPLASTTTSPVTTQQPTFPPPLAKQSRVRNPTTPAAASKGEEAPARGGGGGFSFPAFTGRRSRAPSVTSLASSGGSSRRSSLSVGGGMQPAPSTPTCVVTEFNARGFVEGTREMK